MKTLFDAVAEVEFFSFNTFPYSICFLFAVKSRDFDARSLLLLGADEPLAARRFIRNQNPGD